MTLYMYIGRILIARYELDYTGMVTVAEKQAYQEKIADEMYSEHYRKVTVTRSRPQFYVDGTPSRVNEAIQTLLPTIAQLIEEHNPKKAAMIKLKQTA